MEKFDNLNPEPNQEILKEDGIEYQTFTGVSFKVKKNKTGAIMGYESSSPGRKVIRLNQLPGEEAPDLEKQYTVVIIEDSNKEDPLSGYYVANITSELNKDWPKTEVKVDRAENFARQLHKSRHEIHDETGLNIDERENMDEEKIIDKAKRPRVALKALKKEESLDKIVEDILGSDGSYQRQFISFQYKNLRKALTGDRDIESKIESLRNEESEILRTISDEPSSSELEALDEIKEDLSRAESRREQLVQSSPEAYYGLHLKELKKYKDDLENGRIVETPYVVEHIGDIVSHIRAGRPVMVYGHLGSGKTELALHVARNYILKNRPDIDELVQKEFDEWLEKNKDIPQKEQEKERDEIDASHRSALVISGSKNMSTTELYGHQILDMERIKKEELDAFAKDVSEKYEKWIEENDDKLKQLSPESAEQEKNRAHDRLLQTYLTQFKGGTISNFFLGPIYRAMAEGRPVIIDEVNAIPHEVLISLNHILTRKVGDEVNVQQNSGTAITIREGYGVIMTGNLNQGDGRYVDRQDMDPALLSRLYKIEYDYLPQKTEGSLLSEAGEENELFHLLLARVMDKNGNIEVPEETIDKLWNLAKSARVIQNVFAGKETNSAYYFRDGGMRPIQYLLKESVLSIRGIDKIITQWQKEGYKQELDYYLWKEFVSQSTNPTDKAYLYQLLKDQFGFFASEGWEQRPNYGSGGTINSFEIKAPKNSGGIIEFMGPRQVVDSAFGRGPERERWPDGKGRFFTNRDEALENEEREIKTEAKKEVPLNAESTEVSSPEMKKFLLETFKNWGVSQEKLDSWAVNKKMEVVSPNGIDYQARKDDIDVSKYGEFTMNPNTIDINWESIPQNKIKTETLPTSMNGKNLSEIGEYVEATYGGKYKIPGLEYYKYIYENPDKAPDSLKDGNYHFFFGSLFRGSALGTSLVC